MQFKPKILFVGAFGDTEDGSLGGQQFACNTLIDSPIKSKVEFILIDSTMITLPPPSVFIRGFYALRRLMKFILALVKYDISSVLIFTSSGFSFVEKGIMVFLAKVFKKHVIICPRSGLIIDNVNALQLMKLYIKFVLRCSNTVVCQSQFWEMYYKNLTGLPKNRFKVIKNWLDLTEYRSDIIKDNHRINVLFMGWIEKNKGIYELLAAVKNHQKEMQNFNFIICGKGSEFKNLKKLVEQHGLNSLFSIKGWVSGDEKTKLLQAAHIFILPSFKEGLPNALLEAMASGCAVIATAVGSIPDVIKDHENGILIKKGDSDSLAKSILLLGNNADKRKKFALNARTTVKGYHDINSTWEKFFLLFKSV